MIFLLIAITIISSLLLANLYFISSGKMILANKIICSGLWVIIAVCTFLICSNLAHIGLIFNPQAPDISFMQTIDSQYANIFFTNWFYIAVIAGIYLLLSRKLRIAPPLFLLALFVFVVYLYYPGIPSADGIDTSYSQYLAHSYTDFQPPLFTLWWNIFHVKSAAFIMNSLFYYSGLIYISYFLYKKGLRWQNDLLVLFSLNPLLFTQLAIIWKDVSFTGFLIDCVALYLAILTANNKYLRNGLWIIYFVVVFLATGFRLNGAVAIFPFVLMAIYKLLENYKFSKWKRVIFSGGIGFLITALFIWANFFIVYRVFDAKPTNVQAGQMLSNMAGMECFSNHSYQIDVNYFQPATEDSRQIFCDQVVNYYNNDAYFANWSGTGVMLAPWEHFDPVVVKKQWISALVNHPLIFLGYRNEFFSNVLFYNYWYPTGTLTETPDILSKIAYYQHLDMKMELPLFMIAGTISLLFLCLYYRIYGLSLIILVSSILQLLSLYLLIPNHSARYFFWDYIAVVLAMGLLLMDRKKAIDNRVDQNVLTKKKITKSRKFLKD